MAVLAILVSMAGGLGLGVQPPSPERGAMLSYGRVYLREAWWLSVFLGDGLREALDPKLRRR